MTLKVYKAKRDFKKTPEPKGKKAGGGKELTFVIQKHAASHLHYDFRLEHRGVLVSWAVPKEPPKVAGVKRLAIHVEDHPLSYGEFEGTIPKGNYGAGKVAIWDKGTYSALGAETRGESAKRVEEGLEKGHVAIVLKGKKLKGNYDLIHLKRADKKNMWILVKRK